MRIAHVCMDRGVGPNRKKGAAVHLRAIRASMRELGAEVIEVDDSDADQVRSRLQSLHESTPLDMLYERYSLGATCVSDFSREHGIAHVLEVNAPLRAEASRYRGGAARTSDQVEEARVLENAKLIVAVSNRVAEFAVEAGAAPGRVVVEANGVDLRSFNPKRRSELSTEDCPWRGAFILGAHGRLRPWHNLEMLVSVAARLLELGKNIHVLTVGQGDYEKVLAASLSTDRFTHVPWVAHENVGRWVACFDALPLTYAPHDDYFSPLKLKEAMAAGAVPLVPDLGDLRADVGDGGVVYPVGDESALLAALESLIDKPELRESLGKRAQAVAARSQWLAITKRTLERALGVAL